MIRRIFLMFLVLISSQVTVAFDLEQALTDYKGANFKLSSVKEGIYENAPAIVASFTVPIDLNSLDANALFIKPMKGDPIRSTWVLSEDRDQIYFPFVEPAQKYITSLSSKIKDINGQSLTPISKEVTIASLTPQVVFASTGSVLPLSGQASLPISVVNIDEVELRIHKIDLTRLSDIMNEFGSAGSKYGYYLDRYFNNNLVYTGQFDTSGRKNQRREINLSLDKVEGIDEPGIYAAIMNRAGYYGEYYEYTYFSKSDIGLHVRKKQDQLFVIAQDLNSGQPMDEVELTLLDSKYQQLDQATTLSDGLYSFAKNEKARYVAAKKANHYSLINLSRDQLNLSAMKIDGDRYAPLQMFSWQSRDLFRPGEDVAIDVLLRDDDGKSLNSKAPVRYEIYKPSGGVLSKGTLQTKGSGYYRLEFSSLRSHPTGLYQVKFTYGETKHWHDFKIEEFLPERLTLSIGDGEHHEPMSVENGEEFIVPIDSQYLYGAPASGNKIDGRYRVQLDNHPFENYSDYFFADNSLTLSYNSGRIDSSLLDENGKGNLTFKNRWQEVYSPIQIAMSASVYETGGRPVTRNRVLKISDKDLYIGVRPQTEGFPRYNSNSSFDVIVTNGKGEPIDQKNVTVNLIRDERNWFWTNNSSRGWHWDYNETPQTVFSKSVNIDKDEPTKIAVPLKWGRYALEVEVGKTKTSYDFRTQYYYWGNVSQGSQLKPDLISLSWDKENYQPGEDAQLTLLAPQAGQALITVESSDAVLHQEFIDVVEGENKVTINTQQNWQRHDLYAAVMIVRPIDRQDHFVPKRALGLIHVPLKRANRELNVTIDAPQKIEPEQSITAKINVSSEKFDLQENTKVVVALVDTGILNITNFKTPDAEKSLFKQQSYLGTLIDNYGAVIDNSKGKNVSQTFGGGFSKAKGDLSKGGDKPKDEVQIVAFLSEAVDVDALGNAEITFDLPAFNGQLRWMVLAFNDEQYGNQEHKTTVADKVVTQIAMPRFLAKNDETVIAIDVRNMNDKTMDLNVAIEASQGINWINDEQIKTITLDDKQKQTIYLPTIAMESIGVGTVDLHVYTDDGEIDLKRTWNIGLRAAYPAISRFEYKTIEANQSWTPTLPTADLIDSSVNVQLNISNQYPINFSGHFDYLLRYPYGCLEQTTSSGYPWVLIDQSVLKSLNLEKRFAEKFKTGFSQEFRLQQIDSALSKLAAKQKSNGSFGLWGSNSREEHWLSVYATEFLFEAQLAGAKVDNSILNKAKNRLRAYVLGNNKGAERYSYDPELSRFAYRSYAAFVLAKYDKIELSHIKRLVKESDKHKTNSGLSWAMLAVALQEKGAKADVEIQKAIKFARKPSSTYRYYGYYGSPVRDMARTISLFKENNINEANDLFHELGQAIANRYYLSTQERVQLFRLAAVNAKQTSQTWQGEIVTSEFNQSLKEKGAFNTMLDASQLNSISAIKAGDQTLYGRVDLVGLTKEAPKPYDNGYDLTRTYYDLDGTKRVLDTMVSGDLVLVEIEIHSEVRRPDTLIVELLPAGLELENQNLGASSVSMDNIKIDDKTVKQLMSTSVVHKEFRDDRFVAAINLRNKRFQKVYYLARAVTPGTYQVPGTYVEDMYSPKIQSMGEFGTLTVTAK